MNAISASAFERAVPFGRQYSQQHSNDAFTNARVRVPVHNSEWMAQLRDRFMEVTELPRGWDGYSGRPVSFQVASFAANLLERLCRDDVPAPSIVPGSDGSLQIEWHRNRYDIMIDIRAPLSVDCYRFDLESGEECETHLTNDFTLLATWIKNMAEREY